jgi:proline dehydrogenase
MPGVLEALQRLPDLGDPYADERSAIQRLLALGEPPAERRAAARERALGYIEAVRAADPGLLSAQNLLNSFPLATPEGIALLRLAEALLRSYQGISPALGRQLVDPLDDATLLSTLVGSSVENA